MSSPRPSHRRLFIVNSSRIFQLQIWLSTLYLNLQMLVFTIKRNIKKMIEKKPIERLNLRCHKKLK